MSITTVILLYRARKNTCIRYTRHVKLHKTQSNGISNLSQKEPHVKTMRLNLPQ